MKYFLIMTVNFNIPNWNQCLFFIVFLFIAASTQKYLHCLKMSGHNKTNIYNTAIFISVEKSNIFSFVNPNSFSFAKISIHFKLLGYFLSNIFEGFFVGSFRKVKPIKERKVSSISSWILVYPSNFEELLTFSNNFSTSPLTFLNILSISSLSL